MSKKRRGVGRSMLAAGLGVTTALVAAGGITALAKPEVTEDFSYSADGKRSPFEEQLTGAMNRSFGIDTRVRCEAPAGDGIKGPALSSETKDVTLVSKDGFWLNPGTDYVRVHPVVCKLLERAVDGSTSNIERPAVGYAAATVAMVGADIKYEGTSTNQNACYGVQESGRLLRELGIDRENSVDMAMGFAEHASMYVPEGVSYDPDLCADGKPWDLYPNSPGIQPGNGSEFRLLPN